MNSAKFWDKHARGYAKREISDVAAYETTIERIRHYLAPDQKVLEIGCGTGMTAILLAEHVQHLTACDYSSEMLAIAREKAAEAGVQNIDFEQIALSEISDKNESYDVIMAFNLLHLLDDLPGALKTIKDRLKPGGLFISKSNCLADGGNIWRVPIFLMRLIGYAPDISFLKVTKLDAMVKEAGFELIETGNYPAKPARRFIVARKVD